MKSIYIILTLITFALSACHSGGGRGEQAPTPDANIKNSKAYNDGPVVLFGDSIARGAGSSSPTKSLMGCLNNVSTTSVLNLAQDGASSRDSLNSLNTVKDKKPSLVLISLGGNDVLIDTYLDNFPEAETLSNIKEIFKTLTESGSLVVHLGLNPPQHPQFPTDNSRLLKIKQIASEQGVLFIENSMSGLWGNTDYMADDVHPNDAGYAVVCDRLKSALAPHYNML